MSSKILKRTGGVGALYVHMSKLWAAVGDLIESGSAGYALRSDRAASGAGGRSSKSGSWKPDCC